MTRRLYRHAEVVLLRATTYAGGLTLPESLDLSRDPDLVVEQGPAWLTRVWQHEDIRWAVEAASPVLSQQIHQMLAGHRPEARQVRRIVTTLTSYLLRWQGRATPFGLFAGAGPARVGGETSVRWHEDHKAVARADSEWLGGVISRLEKHPGLLDRLPVVTNSSAFLRGGRLVVPGRPPEGRSGALAPLEISVRNTPPVRTAMEAAHEPIQFGELVKVLATDFPTAAPEQISTMLAELVAHNLLLTSLRAPLTIPDALGYLRAQLEATDADELPDLKSLVDELRAIHDELSRHNHSRSPATAQAIRDRVADRMRAVCGTAPQPLVIDTGLNCEIAIAEAVIGEAETAASTLLRVTPYPDGHPRWQDYHLRFRERYGTGTVVSVHELVADTGLGLPAGYLGSPLGSAERTLTQRDETLLALVQQTVLNGAEEIVLTEPVIRNLTVGDPVRTLLPPRAELAFQLHAASPEAVRHGRFRLLVTSAPRSGSSMAGRFADLLPETERKRLGYAYAALSTDDPQAIAAQLSFPPRRRRSENVARTPELLPQTISLSEHRDPHRDLIDLNDLAVSTDDHQLYLIQVSTGRRVEPRVLHALEPGVLTPPLARFLAEITTARCAVYKAFDWGAAVRLPYLPRLRYGRTVLSPARWLVTATDLPALSAALPDWETALDAWRQRLRVPANVVLCETDQRLPLDLEQPLHRALLRTRLHLAGNVELREAPTPDDLAWIGRAHELLLPLRSARIQATGRQPKTSLLPRSVEHDAGHPPGRSPWLYAQIHGHPDRQNEILAEHLPHLLDGWDEPTLWWFQRHSNTTLPDHEQHLGLYVRLPTAELYGKAAARIGDWAADLRDRSLVPHVQLATYHPQIGRYGHGEAMAAAEEVFAADSAVALAQIELAAHTGTSPEAITAAGLLDLAASYADTPGEGMHWLINHLPQEKGRLDRELRDEALHVADPRDDWATLCAQPGGENVLLAWERRRTALTCYRSKLARQRDPGPALRSLIHLHHVRTLGMGPARERVTNRLARAAALRHIARERRTQR